LPIIREHFRAGTFPVALIPKLGELGLLGANLSGFGLPGISNVAYGLVMQELDRGDSGLRSLASVQGALVMYPILTFGSDAQKQRWLPPLAAGSAVGCFGLTEPDHGSDPEGMKTKAVRDGNTFILNGSKMWITNGSIADVALVWAKLDGVIRGFLIEKGTPGFSVHDIKSKLSMRASITSELVLDEVRVPGENLLPKAEGLKAPLQCLTQARYGIAWGAVGAAMACFEAALSYTCGRKQFGRPIASFQLTQAKLADMLTDITKAQLLAFRLGRLKDAGVMRHTQVSLAKRNNVRMALEVARTARGMLGANGISDEYPVMRHLCNLETVETYEGTYEIHTLILGKDLTGLDAMT
jgi:glutaryl-CoA dehydrogenase